MGVRGVVRISVLLSVLAFTGDVVSILDEPEARLGLSRIELLGVEVTFTDILSRIDDETEMFELTVFERDGALGVTVGDLGGVSLHLATSVRKRATSWAFSFGGSRILTILSATAFAMPGLATKSSKIPKTLDFKFRCPRPFRFMIEDLGYFPSLSADINLYQSGRPVLRNMYAQFMFATGG